MSQECVDWVFEHSPTTGDDRLMLLALAFAADELGVGEAADVATCKQWTRLGTYRANQALIRLNHQRPGLQVSERRYRVVMES